MRLAHDVYGPAEAPVVVLLGSLGTTTALWRPQVEGLSGSRRLVLLDLPGHGRSTQRHGSFGVADIANDVLETVDSLGVTRFSFVGLSIGGMVGQSLAVLAPGRLDRLAVLFSAAAVPQPQGFRDRAAEVRRSGGVAYLVPTLLKRWFTADYRATHPGEIQRVARMVEGIPAEGYAGCAEALADADLRPDLPKISAPTLVVGGAQDQALPPECSLEIARGIGSARHVELDPGAHLGNIERAETVNATLKNFLAQ
ncbi:3-oxoadipate enol-lactonase [Amycolatopsis ultiminotia]|uniref:3-oxoadipate enol-lactonase n=1 Tax=Amycolatopsis ultiminotia TaxID=543629 RepID=A0ABP6YRJ7_9PSEU